MRGIDRDGCEDLTIKGVRSGLYRAFAGTVQRTMPSLLSVMHAAPCAEIDPQMPLSTDMDAPSQEGLAEVAINMVTPYRTTDHHRWISEFHGQKRSIATACIPTRCGRYGCDHLIDDVVQSKHRPSGI